MRKLFHLFFFVFVPVSYGQEVNSLMEDLQREDQELVMAIFKSPKLVLLQTNELQKKQNLAFWVGHRFGDIGGEFGGSRSLFGLDTAADIHLGFDYGVTNDLTIGIGRSRYNETYNFQAKYGLFHQRESGMPVSVTLFGQNSWITRKELSPDEFNDQSDRISHFLEVIVAKKISPSLSFMLNPGYLLRSQAEDPRDKERFFVLGMGGRFKITRRISIISDNMWVNGLDRPSNLSTEYFNPLGVGIEIETGGHVFSLNFQNASYVTENNFIPNNDKSWRDGGVRFGFSIIRNFYLGPKEPAN